MLGNEQPAIHKDSARLAPTVERMMRLCFGERPRSNGDIIDDDVPCDLVLVGYLTIIADWPFGKVDVRDMPRRAPSEGRWHGRAGDLFSAIVKLMVDKFDAVDSICGAMAAQDVVSLPVRVTNAGRDTASGCPQPCA